MVSNLQKLLDLYCIGGHEQVVANVDKPEFIKVRLRLDSKVKALYKKIEGEYDKELKQKVIDTGYLIEKGIKVSNQIEAAIRRQQLTSNCQLFDPNLRNVKFEWIEDWLRGTDEKVIIFSKFAKTIEALEKYLKDKRFAVSVVKRQQSAPLRKNAIEQWKKHAQVLLGTFGVLGEGIDGLQEACRYAIFVDRDWTASTNEQAEKRVYRTGQTMQPIFYILQAIGTIDIRIEKVQLDKGADAAELLNPVSEEEE
jgi:SNF2 family DNA or RNA helicase